MKRADRAAFHRELRGAEATLACVALGLDDPRALDNPDLQEMCDRLLTVILTINKTRAHLANVMNANALAALASADAGRVAGIFAIDASAFACKVCQATPDGTGTIEHGRGCYTVSEEGGGTSYVAEADETASAYTGADHG